MASKHQRTTEQCEREGKLAHMNIDRHRVPLETNTSIRPNLANVASITFCTACIGETEPTLRETTDKAYGEARLY